jgi:transcriptional regulator with XRE-family HTH domain
MKFGSNDGEQVGALIRQLRLDRHMSLSKLAIRAAVAKSTLSYWESQARVPSIPELEAVLTALEVAPATRISALKLIDAPRAVQRLRSLTQGAPPLSGDLLRAMRMRRKWSQERLATVLCVRRSSVSKWESGELWPASETLRQLCVVLRATSQEQSALAQGRVSFGRETGPTTSDSAAERLWVTLHDSSIELRDLMYLSLEADLWGESQRHADGGWARPMLCEVYSRHAQFMEEQDRLTEAKWNSQTVINMCSALPEHLDRFVPAAIAYSKVLALGPNGSVNAAMETIRTWLSLVKTPLYRSWLLSDLAAFFALRRDAYEAVELFDAACEQAEHTGMEVEIANRRWEYAENLVQLGRVHEARGILNVIAPSSTQTFKEAYIHGQVALALGERPEAEQWGARMKVILSASNSLNERLLSDSFGHRVTAL